MYHLIPALIFRRWILRLCGYNIGKKVYVPASLHISDLGNRRNNIYFGDRVSIGPNVLLITDSSPNNSRLLKLFPLISGNIKIEADTWLGANVTVLPGVTIGECSIIAAGSVVTDDIPEYCIAAGVPAKVIKNIDKNDL